MDGLAAQSAPALRSILRIVAGLLYFFHGTQKLLAFPAESPRGIPEMLSLPWISGVLELVLGGLLIIGLFSRPAAFVASGHMAFAYFLAHQKLPVFSPGFYPVMNGGDAAVLFCFVFLYIAAAGPGPLSLDRAFRGSAVP